MSRFYLLSCTITEEEASLGYASGIFRLEILDQDIPLESVTSIRVAQHYNWHLLRLRENPDFLFRITLDSIVKSPSSGCWVLKALSLEPVH